MNPIAGLSTTGRRLHGPASDLIELVSESGYRHTAIVFHPEYRDHPAINSALSVVVGFLESPMVTGMVELFSHDTSEGAFIYPTGQATSVAELNRTFADFGEAPGVRAGLELMFAAGEILIEAAETGESHGVYSHGGLTPWRLMIKPDGQVQIIGHALPQVEILRFHADPQAIPREDSFRYCPPERMEAGAEDIRSDLFALALIAFELMTGKPVYDGLVNDIRAMASRAEGSRRLFRFRDQLPRSVLELLKICLRRDTEDRFADGEAFMDALQAALGGPDIQGPSLMDVMARAGQVPQRVGTPLQDGGATMMVTRDKLAEMVGEQEEAPKRQAWKPPTRKRRASPRAAASEPVPAAEPQAAPPAPEPSPEPPPATPAVQEILASSTDGPKWRRPSRRSSPRRPPSASVDEQLEGPGSSEPPPEPAPRRASSLVNDIIGASGRRPPARRRAPPRKLGSVDEAGPAPTPPADPGVADEPVPVPSGRPPRRPPPRHAPAPELPPSVEPGPPPPPPPTVSGGAGGGDAPARLPPPPVAPADQVAPTPPWENGTEPPAPLDPETSFGELPTAQAPAAPAPEPEPPSPEPPPAPAPVVEVQPEAPPAPSVAPEGVAPQSVARLPDPVPADAVKGEMKLFRLRLGPKSKDRRFRLPVDQPVSEAVAKLVGMLLPVRCDATGGLRGWYRFSQGGVQPAGNPTMGAFDDGQPLELVLVPNRVELLSLTVQAERPASLVLQLGLAVPACAIVDHVAELLSLPAGRWRLYAGGEPLQPHGILADLPDLDTLELVIRP
jgi:hypothetical protein